MVDLVVLQSLSYVAAAVGVCLAAFYYALNLREASKNRKLVTATGIINNFMTEERNKLYLDLLTMEWKDFEDFAKKYDSRVNPDNWVKRASWWAALDLLGYQWRNGLIDTETIYGLYGAEIEGSWRRFGPIIREYRKSDYPSHRYMYFEALAEEIIRLFLIREPGYLETPSYLDESVSDIVSKSTSGKR